MPTIRQACAGDLVNHLDLQIEYLKNQQMVMPPAKRVMVSGKAGCGKSTIIKEIIRRVTNEFGPDSIVVSAPTGSAAINIDGKTIHSSFQIPTRSQFAELQGE